MSAMDENVEAGGLSPPLAGNTDSTDDAPAGPASPAAAAATVDDTPTDQNFKTPVSCSYFRRLQRPFATVVNKLRRVKQSIQDHQITRSSSMNDAFAYINGCRIWEKSEDDENWVPLQARKTFYSVSVEESGSKNLPVLLIRSNRNIITFLRITRHCRIREAKEGQGHVMVLKCRRGSNPEFRFQFFRGAPLKRVKNAIQAKIDDLRDAHRLSKKRRTEFANPHKSTVTFNKLTRGVPSRNDFEAAVAVATSIANDESATDVFLSSYDELMSLLSRGHSL